MTQKTLITLDLDGTVSPITDDAPIGYETLHLAGFECLVRPEVIQFINDMSKLEPVTVLWASSWEYLTKQFDIESEFRLPHLDYIAYSRDYGTKAEGIAATAVKLGVDVVHVFEDDAKVAAELRRLQKAHPEEYPFRVISHLSTKSVGITDAMISATVRQISPHT